MNGREGGRKARSGERGEETYKWREGRDVKGDECKEKERKENKPTEGT